MSKLLDIKRDSKNFYSRNSETETTHYTIDMIRDRMNTEGYYLFAFVRNPYTRMMSAYKHRMKNIANIKLYPVDRLCSFDEYMTALDARWSDLKDIDHYYKAHVVPQREYVDRSVNIYRYEDFDSECDKLRRMFGINREVTVENVSDGRCGLSDEAIDIISRLYREDFELFNYKQISY